MSGTGLRQWLDERPWVWSFGGASLVYAATVIVAHGQGGLLTLQVAAQFSTFYVVVGIGQMLVMSGGAGNIDLSIPGVMILASYFGLDAAGMEPTGMPAGIVAAVVVALAAGGANVLLIFLFDIPPMIATLACGFVLQSIAIAYSGTHSAFAAPFLPGIVGYKFYGLPLLSVAFVMVAVGVHQMLRRTTFGRSLLAIGQSPRAAFLAGIRVKRTLAFAYLLSAVLAGLSGLLLAAFSGGASLEMGSDYLLMSIAVVVLGGTSVAGGQASVAGVWGAAILLQLVLTMLNVVRVSDGARYLTTGLIILSVLTIAKGRRT
jgi:ribose transport system permease protein